MTDTVMTETMAVPPPEPPRPPTSGPGDWVRRNLFRSPIDGAVTIVAGAVVAYVVFRLARFVFVTGRWDIVRDNLKLFTVGRYPDDQLWRVAVALAVIALAGGVVAGYAARRSRLRAPREPQSWWRRVLGIVAAVVAADSWHRRAAGPGRHDRALARAAGHGRRGGRRSVHRAAAPPRSTPWLVLVCVLGAVGLVWFLTRPAGWDDWGGLMLNLFLAAAAITLCFPLGVLLALGAPPGGMPAAGSTPPCRRWFSACCRSSSTSC